MPIITKPAKPPLWATNVGVVVEPTEPKKQEGWAAEKPAYQHMNWVHNTNYNWQQYFESYFDAITNSGLKFDDTNSKFGIGNTSFNSNIQRFQVNDITELFSTNHVALFAAPNTNFGPALGLIGDQFGRTLFGYEKGYDTNTGGSFNISIENTRVDFSAFRDGQTANATDLTLNKLGGNVGIGTSNPGIVPGFSRYLSLSILEAETAPAFELEGNRTTDSPIADLKFINNGAEIATVRAIRNGDNTTADLAFLTSALATNIERMRIKSDGFIGIGTPNPDFALHVKHSLDTQAVFESMDISANIQIKDSIGTAVLGSVNGDFVAGGSVNESIFKYSFSAPNSSLSINSSGNVGIGVSSAAGKLECREQGNDATIIGKAVSSSYASSIFLADADRTNSSAFNFLQARSNASSDIEFILRGDGNAFADGTFSGGGADYAEYFESVSGKSIEPGTSVILEGDKVRPAKSNETPDGVIRPDGASVIIGNNHWNHWKDKYLKTDYGAYKLKSVKYVQWEEDQFEEKTVQKIEAVKEIKTIVEKVGNKWIQKKVVGTLNKPVFNKFPVFDENGDPVYTIFKPEKTIRIIEKKAYIDKKGNLIPPVYKNEAIPAVKKNLIHEEPVMIKRKVKVGTKTVKVKVSEIKQKKITPPKNAIYFENDERILNPDYDPNIKYIPPEKRNEKILVGLIGQIPITKGQPLAPSWKKMKEINTNVDMYLVK